MNDSDKTKEQLLEELKLLRLLLDNLPDRLYIKDKDGRFVFLNKAVYGDAEIPPPEDIIGKTDFDLFPRDRAAVFYAEEQNIIKTGQPMVNKEVVGTHRDTGQPHWSLSTKLPWRDKDGNINGIIGANRDITERKIAEQALQESEARYKAIFESAREGILVADIETKRFVYANPAICSMLGYTAEELNLMNINDIHPKNFLPMVNRDFEKKAKGQKEISRSIPCLRKDGTIFYADISTANVVIDQKALAVGFFVDITQYKQSEEALRESEARYRAIFESAREGIFVTDIETKKFKYANPAICKMFGYTEEELSRMSVHDIHPKEYVADAIDHFEAMARGERVQSHNVPCLRRDGTLFYADINTTIVTINNCLCNVGFFTDVTQHKRDEEALRESEQRYRLLIEQLPAVTYTAAMDEASTTIYVSPQVEEILGILPDDYKADPDLWLKSLYPDDRRRVLDELEESHKTGKSFSCEYRMTAKDGRIVWVHDDARIVRDDKGNPLHVQGVMYDITAHRKTEDALHESEARHKAIFNSATEGIIVADIETKRLKYVNPAICRMFGYTAEKLQQMTVYDIHPKEHMPSVIAGFEAQARGEKTLLPDVPCLHRNGTVFYADIDTTCVVIDQRPCNVGLFTNITERKHAEEALRQSEEKFRGLTERSFDMVFMTDAKGFITYLSPASRRIFDFQPEEMVGKHFASFLKKSEIPKATKRFTDKLQGKKLDSLLLEAKKKDGSRVFIELISSLIMQNGVIQGTQGIIRDVTDSKKAEEELQKAHDELEARVRKRTADLAMAVEKLQNEINERKHAEASLRNAEQRFRTIFENTIVGLYRTTPDGRVLMANPALVKMLGYKSFGELAKVNLEKKGLDPSTPRSIFKKLIEKKGKVIGLESIWIRRDGSRLYVSESAFAAKDSNGNILYYEGTAQDITKRKEAEEKLLQYQEQLRLLASQQSLADEQLRRRIASELHDHISQDLAISKMKLESLADPAKSDLNASLKEVIGLIAHTIDVSRSLTFEMSPPVLYELGFEAAIGWLVNQTRKRFGINAEFTDDGNPKPLDTDVRVTLFHAVRELLINVVKHAKARMVKVSASQIRGHVQITVEDDGIGFDASRKTGGGHVSHKAGSSDYTSGFGLFNIRERLNHIGGKVNIRSKPGKGTRVTLIAPLNIKTKHSRGVKK